MEQELITYYKLQLAHDLIMFLAGLSINGLPPEDKAKKVNQILETWEQRVDTQVKIMRDEKVREAAEAAGLDVDVQSILAGISALEPELVRKEFKVEARHSMVRSFVPKKAN